ncbi:STAS domain-containing protein [candidate division KSB1 bacterium]|nr:STAS domain-containing protein [candidate division KSB1 bacterium]NIR72945.1 STAS domain-containing protein [candidate division KSB1 bacterium]NIS28244.1 STAS domain-containing protein [candidate division KSB1 bacterium]NIT75133.1 STAS domain-containing protein [candidate division KSB1 bacterium]NIU28921.1 STAS domain-containing protein [candidate division KSB1 bacterium]
MDGMLVTTEKAQMRGEIAVIKVHGYLDMNAAQSLDHAIDSLLQADCYDIIFDLGDVKYIGSRGWSVFLSKIKHVRDHGGDLKLARMKPSVYEVYKLLEFFWFLRSYATVEEAVSAFYNHVPPMPE